MGGVRSGDAEEDWHLDLNPGTAAMQRGNDEALGLPLPRSLGSQQARCSSDVELSLRSLEECKRRCGKGGGERTTAGGPGEDATQVWIKNWRSQ